jgi:hypothetical protein
MEVNLFFALAGISYLHSVYKKNILYENTIRKLSKVIDDKSLQEEAGWCYQTDSGLNYLPTELKHLGIEFIQPLDFEIEFNKKYNNKW